jgi:hypothetical protein
VIQKTLTGKSKAGLIEKVGFPDQNKQKMADGAGRKRIGDQPPDNLIVTRAILDIWLRWSITKSFNPNYFNRDFSQYIRVSH